jgi:ribosome biogenesis GTPase A
MGTRYLRRCFSQNVNAPYESQEFVSQNNNDFKLIRQENRKVLKIAILGAPNVGKSTIINQLIKRSVIIYINYILNYHSLNIMFLFIFLFFCT